MVETAGSDHGVESQAGYLRCLDEQGNPTHPEYEMYCEQLCSGLIVKRNTESRVPVSQSVAHIRTRLARVPFSLWYWGLSGAVFIAHWVTSARS